MAVELEGKVAVVTGSSKGIGYAIAETLARAGAHVVVSARNEDEVAEAARRLDGLGGGRAIGVPCDVRDYEQVRRLIARAVEELGSVDVLVNNAGVGGFASVDEMAPEQWDRILETNLSGVFYATHEAIPHMKARGAGWIVNIGSLAGKNAFVGGAAYNASKFGLIGFSEALMLDVRHHGIRVSYVMPGSVNTHFNDKEPSDANAWMIQPEDLARVVLDIVSLPERTLVSRVEVRPSRPKARG